MASYRMMKLMGLMIMVMEILGGSSKMVSGQNDCGNLSGLAVLIGCQNFLLKDKPRVAPSADCCGAIKSIGMKCTCEVITKEIEQILSMEKLVYVAAACGQPLAKGSQCGSYKVPAAA